MLFSTYKQTIGAIAIGTAMLATSVSAAREDNGGGWKVGSAASAAAVVHAHVSAVITDDLAAIEPAAGGKLLVAAAPEPPQTPRLPAVPISNGSRLGAFGSIAISAGKLPSAAKWRRVTATDFSAFFTERCARAGLAACDSAFAKRLQAARRTASGKDSVEALRFVNAAVNAALPYTPDRSAWSMGDYWATPIETAGKGEGDCEDFAIAKLWMLRSLGFSADQLQLVVLKDTRKGIYHAVLAVHLNGQRYILDNLYTEIARDSAFSSYLPIMSFVGDKSYIHGFENKRSDMAGTPKDLSAVLPGEGV